MTSHGALSRLAASSGVGTTVARSCGFSQGRARVARGGAEAAAGWAASVRAAARSSARTCCVHVR